MAIRGPVSLKKPVRRCLFGAPDHERIRKDLDRALSDMDRSTKADMKNNWGFDIETDSGVPGGRYEITEVKEDEYVPSFYRKGYSTKSRRVRDRSSVNMVSSGTQVDNTTSTAVTTVSSSTQAGRGLDSPLSPALAGAVVNGVRRLDFKENDFHVSGTNTSTNQRSRTRSVVPSSFHQSTMKDHYQPRKRRSPDIDTSLPRESRPDSDVIIEIFNLKGRVLCKQEAGWKNERTNDIVHPGSCTPL